MSDQTTDRGGSGGTMSDFGRRFGMAAATGGRSFN
jgi:hypothetical protein